MMHAWRMDSIDWPIVGRTGRCTVCERVFRPEREAEVCPGPPARHPTDLFDPGIADAE